MTEYTIYGKANCSYCDKAKALLDGKGLKYVYHDVMADLDQRTEMFRRVPVQVNTVPQILLGDTYIGGFTELNASFTD
jgi:glutaredoxin 1